VGGGEGGEKLLPTATRQFLVDYESRVTGAGTINALAAVPDGKKSGASRE